MKLLRLITEERKILPFHKRMLKLMSREGIDDEVSDIWNFLTKKLQIEKLETKLEIIHLYQKYYGMDDEDIDAEISDSDFEDMKNIEDVDDKVMALSLHLNIPPILLEEESYSHYGLEQYRNVDDNTSYAIGDDQEVQDAMREYFENYVENQGGIEYLDRSIVDDFIELDDWSVEQFAEEEAEYRVEDMDEDEVIDEAGYDDKDSFEEKINELEVEIDEMESEKDDLEIELLELDEEDEDEMAEIEERIEDLEYEISDKESEKEDLESELDSLYDTAKEELIETYKEDIISEIEYSGVDYFINEYGWSLEDAVDKFATFDNDGLEEYLADMEDRGDILSPYDGEENEEEYDGEWYYIYRID